MNTAADHVAFKRIVRKLLHMLYRHLKFKTIAILIYFVAFEEHGNETLCLVVFVIFILFGVIL